MDTEPLAGMPELLVAMGTTPNPQSASAFFATLPLEIRRHIYRQLWESCGMRQHIYGPKNSCLGPELTHAKCITDPDAKDIRGEELMRRCQADHDATTTADYDGPGDIDGAYLDLDASDAGDDDEEGDTFEDWYRRWHSSWCNHWACEEDKSRAAAARLSSRPSDISSGNARPNSHFSPFLVTLLSCKRMHEEARQSIYENITFLFTDLRAMTRFLETVPSSDLEVIKALHLLWQQPLLYSPLYELDISFPSLGDEFWCDSQRLWSPLWSKVEALLPRLKELRIFEYPKHLYDPIPQRKWFESLYKLKGLKDLETFTVKLMWQHEGESDEEIPDFLQDAPFAVSIVTMATHDLAALTRLLRRPTRGLRRQDTS